MEAAAMNRRLAGLSAVAAVLGGFLVFQGFDHSPTGRGGDVPAAVVAAPTGTAKLNPLQDLDPKAFTAIVDRPLFNPSRQPRPLEPVAIPQPPQVEQPPPPPPPPSAPDGPGPDDYKLLGVSSGPDGRIAALRIASSGDVVFVRKGENVDGWSVVEVGERSVAIGAADSPVTYDLFATVDQTDGEQSAAPQPRQAQPLPLPLPMPQPGKPPGLPEQHSVPDTGG